MQRDWEDRAGNDARFFVNNARSQWSDRDFFESGEANVDSEILTDMPNVCQGMNPREMSILEIGCGVGRMTRAFCSRFGEVHAVDISSGMIAQARENLKQRPNVVFHQTNGLDLVELPSSAFDFAFSYIVFQHIPSVEIIESLLAEVGRVLKPGRLFKFQVQGVTGVSRSPDDTWLGTPVSPEEARSMAERTGFELRYSAGEGTQYYWLWFFKKGAEKDSCGTEE